MNKVLKISRRFPFSSSNSFSIRKTVPIVSQSLNTRKQFKMSFSDSKKSLKKASIYTRTGDKGTSALYTGERRPKNDIIFEALGTTDELNSFVGVARTFCESKHESIEKQLIQIQSTLLDLGSHVATPRNNANETKIAKTKFKSSVIEELEQWIDQMDSELPALKNFVLPSGGKLSAHLHVCRSVTRRLERILLPLVNESIDQQAGVYVNRLSDYFFQASRYACQIDGEKETIYHPGTALEQVQD